MNPLRGAELLKDSPRRFFFRHWHSLVCTNLMIPENYVNSSEKRTEKLSQEMKSENRNP